MWAILVYGDIIKITEIVRAFWLVKNLWFIIRKKLIEKAIQATSQTRYRSDNDLEKLKNRTIYLPSPSLYKKAMVSTFHKIT